MLAVVLAEVELRLLDGRLAQHLLEGRDVGGLVRLHDLGHGEVLARQAGLRDGLLVELVLEVLERQRVVQDLDVLLLRRGAQRDAGETAQQHAASQGGRATEGGLAEEVGAAVTGDGLFGLADGAVLVYDVQLHQIGHVIRLLPCGIGGLLAVLRCWRGATGFGSPSGLVGAAPLVASRPADPASTVPRMAATAAEPQPAKLPLPGGSNGALRGAAPAHVRAHAVRARVPGPARGPSGIAEGAGRPNGRGRPGGHPGGGVPGPPPQRRRRAGGHRASTRRSPSSRRAPWASGAACCSRTSGWPRRTRCPPSCARSEWTRPPSARWS